MGDRLRAQSDSSTAGLAELFQNVDWISDRLGDEATGYNILSVRVCNAPLGTSKSKPQTVRTASSFIISRNELNFAKEVGDAFYLYRVFRFRQSPLLYMMRGDISKQVHLDPIDYRASFRQLVS